MLVRLASASVAPLLAGWLAHVRYDHPDLGAMLSGLCFFVQLGFTALCLLVGVVAAILRRRATPESKGTWNAVLLATTIAVTLGWLIVAALALFATR